MTRVRPQILLLVLLLFATPLLAGTVYVPLIENLEVEGKTVTAQLVVTNTDFRNPASFTTHWIPSDSDGTLRDESVVPVPIVVDPGKTVLMNATPEDGSTGLLEVSADESLIVQARQVTSDEEGGAPSVEPLPIISSESIIPTGEAGYLQGLERTRLPTETDIGIANLGHEPAQCIVRLFRSQGLQIQGTVVLSLLPLSLSVFTDAFPLVGEQYLLEARLELSCNQPSYALASVGSDDFATQRYVMLSVSGDSSLRRPGEGPTKVVLERPGLFFRPVDGNSFLEIDLPLEPGVPYQSIEISFDLFLRNFHTDLFHGLVGMRRPGTNLYFAMFVRGDNSRTVVDLGDHSEIKDAGPWRERSNYNLNILYDGKAGTMTFVVRGAGAILDGFVEPIAFRDLTVTGSPIDVVFGLSKVFDNAFFPPWGWEYSNLRVVATEDEELEQ